MKMDCKFHFKKKSTIGCKIKPVAGIHFVGDGEDLPNNSIEISIKNNW